MDWEKETKVMPKIPIKKTATTIGILIAVLMIGFSFYFNIKNYYVKWKDEIYQQGRLNAMQQIINQLQQTGQVIFTSPEGNIILVPKPPQ